jgi:type IV pilus assembly protein PilY1
MALRVTAAALIACLPAAAAHAALLSISNNPLSSASSASVKPNLLLTFDSSGSMGWDFMPDNAAPDISSDFGETASTAYNCLQQGAGPNTGNNNCSLGDPPYYANQYNFVAYNPTFTYAAGVNYDGSSKGDQTTFTAVSRDAYSSTAGTIDLTGNNYTEQVYQNANAAAGGPFFKRNGEPYPQGNVPPTQSGVTPTMWSYSTPLRASLTGVTISNFGSNTTVTGTVGSGTTPAVGEIIDVVCTAPSTFAIANAVPVITSSGNTFTFTAGGTWGGLSCTSATVHYSVIGLPEQADASGYTKNATGGAWNVLWGFSVPFNAGLTSIFNNASKVVTVNYYNHGLVVGDLITVSGGGAACNITNTPVVSVTKGTGVLANVPISFTYKVGSTTQCSGTYAIKRQAYNAQITGGTTPFFYTITPAEYCSDRHLTTCAAALPGGLAPPGYPFPAYVRYCKTQTGANSAQSAAGVTGPNATNPYCQSKYLYSAGYIYPRYGQYTRIDILTANTYPKYAGRSDCGAASCSGTQEMTNFANWHAYYRTRLAMMKTLLGQSLLNLTNAYRVGFITINPGTSTSSPVSSTNQVTSARFVPINDFTSAQRQTLYTTLYAQTARNSTPLRSALARAGRYFAGKHDKINAGMADDPVQYSCQQNFTLLTTDGYWNTNLANGDLEAVQLDGSTAIGDQDSNANFQVVTPGPTAAQAGIYEGAKGVNYGVSPPSTLNSCAAGSYSSGGCSNTLADVAAYYYNTDLRPAGSTNLAGIDVSLNNVFKSDSDPATWQHMTTFTLGLADGLMTFQTNYQSLASGDFYNIQNQNTDPTCWWQPSSGTNVCQWPVPLHDSPTAIDDLWHAAVNGHGQYYHGTNPRSVAQGITSTLNSINVRLAAAAASSTSSPNITQQNNIIYSSTYDTVQWSGDLIAQTVDPSTGNVNPTVLWNAANTLDGMVGASSDSRTIYTYDLVNSTIKPFAWASLTASEQSIFLNICSVLTTMTQCPLMSGGQVSDINNGQYLFNFLRGQRGREGDLFRTRVHVLGDTVDAQPAYVAAPIYSFADSVTPTYAAYVTAQASRQPVLYIGANDGMLHAFNASVGGGANGAELWAYVPRMLFSNLYPLADTAYSNMHTFYVDGSPVTMDAYYGGSWHTVLVGGLNSGGRGFYALDVTNPASPVALWEFCQSATLCKIADADLGLSYGNPVITKRASDGRWVVLVTSGYNNVSPGTGLEYLYVLDLQTGTVLQKIGTGTGSTTTPGGLAKIAAWADNFMQDNTTKYVYGGDLQGNVWRFDLTVSPATVSLMGVARDGSGATQPITTRPELGAVTTSRIVYIATGEYVGIPDLGNTQVQSLYAFRDKGSSYGNFRTSGQLVQQTITVSGSTSTTSNNNVNWASSNGWYIDFPNTGERVNIDPQLALGTLLIATNVPGNNACTVGGSSWHYEFNSLTGTYVSTSPGQVVGIQSQNAVTVGFVVVQLPSGALKRIDTDATANKQTQGVNVGAAPANGKRVGWRTL